MKSLKRALIVCFVPALAAAEPQGKEGFFEKDFSKSPITSDAQAIIPKSEKPTAGGDDQKAKISESVEPSPTPLSADFDNRKKARIDSIGLILNALNREQAASKVKELLELANKYDFGVGQVLMVGGMPGPEILVVTTAIVARGGEVSVSGSVPYRYKISKSPTWILKSDEGEILLEGIGSIKSDFDKDGNFIYPEAPLGAEAASGAPNSEMPSAGEAVKEALEAAKALPLASGSPVKDSTSK